MIYACPDEGYASCHFLWWSPCGQCALKSYHSHIFLWLLVVAFVLGRGGIEERLLSLYLEMRCAKITQQLLSYACLQGVDEIIHVQGGTRSAWVVRYENVLGDAARERSSSITIVCAPNRTTKSLGCQAHACCFFESADLEDPKCERKMFDFITRLWNLVSGNCYQSWQRDFFFNLACIPNRDIICKFSLFLFLSVMPLCL